MNSNERPIADNLAEVQERIATACGRAGRSPESVQLIAVTKYAERAWVETLIDLGVQHLGESRPQQLIERHLTYRAVAGLQWHLIGHLQRNKVRPMLPVAARIHSVDTRKLLDRIELLAAEIGLKPRVLLEVNIADDASKDGFARSELISRWKSLADCQHVQIQGLMTMAPHTENEDVIRTAFQNLRELRDELASRSEGKLRLPELSMGMSGDFEIAIEEGATHVRVGSSLFTGLDSPPGR